MHVTLILSSMVGWEFHYVIAKGRFWGGQRLHSFFLSFSLLRLGNHRCNMMESQIGRILPTSRGEEDGSLFGDQLRHYR